MTVSERFWKKVYKTENCWEWRAALSHGYGRFWNGIKYEPAHRFSYREAKGDIPKQLVIDHLCRNTKCVKPLHLEAVSNWENTKRGLHPFAINARKKECKYGHLFDKKNTYITPRGTRDCRLCRRDCQRVLRAQHV